MVRVLRGAHIVFFLMHSLHVRPPLRPSLQARLGASGLTLAYSALSLAVLAWLFGAAGRVARCFWHWCFGWRPLSRPTEIWPM